MVYLTPQPAGPATLGAWPGPFRLRPSVFDRRGGLRLDWTGPRRVAAVDLSAAPAALTNTAATRWKWDPEDRGFVVGWLVAEDGSASGPSSFAYGAYQFPLHDLDPEEALELTVDFGPDVRETMPGRYQLELALPALRLRSEPVSIEVL